MQLTFPIERCLQWLKAEPFRQLARQSGWLKRQGKIDAFDFVWSLVLGQMSALRLTLNAQAQNLLQPVTRQSIHERYNPSAVAYFKAAFDYSFAQLLDQGPDQPLAQALRAHFSAVYLVDSTSFDCPAALQELFPGCGGDGSPANVKVLLRYEFIEGRLEPLQVLPGKRSDQGLAKDLARGMQAGQLYIHDKGFFTAAAWRQAQAQNAFLLAPWPRSASLWVRPDPAGPEVALDLAQELARLTENQQEWAQVEVGQGAHRAGPLRIVAFRLSEQSANRARAKLHEALRRQGRQPTEAALTLAGWLILVTNASAQQLPARVLSYVYRVRWQVELAFRACKWVLRLDQSESENPHRVQCEIWARLICALLTFNWHAHANAACWQQYRQEISFEQLSRLLQQWGHTVARALVQGSADLSTLLQDLWRRILKNARKGRQKTRTNTWDLLWEHWLKPTPATP
jgi:hypothetical protein